MELNGIANMKLIMMMAEEDKQISPEVFAKLNEQLNVMISYLKAYEASTQVVSPIPAWHEIKAKLGVE